MIIKINKKYFIAIMATLLVIAGAFFVVSYGGSSPSVVGHSAGELTGVCKSDGIGCPVVNHGFIGFTPSTYRPSSIVGYKSASSKCDSIFSNSRVCSANDVIYGNFPSTGGGWIATPGYSAQDCGEFGRVYNIINKGTMILNGQITSGLNCNQNYALACCYT